MTPVRTMTPMSTNPRTRLGKLPYGWIMKVIIQRIDPVHNMIANQFVISLIKRIQAGVFSFSGNLLSPSSKFLFTAASVDKPISKLA